MQIFDFAKAQEMRAEKTYLECAAKAEQPALKAVFNLLAKAEQNHQKVIRELERNHPIQVPTSGFLADSRNHLHALAPDKNALHAAGSQLDVYREARRQEEVAENFYREKATEAADRRLEEIFTALAAQEHDHFLVLDWLVDLVSNPESNLENAEFNRH